MADQYRLYAAMDGGVGEVMGVGVVVVGVRVGVGVGVGGNPWHAPHHGA
jgi:hypothetical protein